VKLVLHIFYQKKRKKRKEEERKRERKGEKRERERERKKESLPSLLHLHFQIICPKDLVVRLMFGVHTR